MTQDPARLCIFRPSEAEINYPDIWLKKAVENRKLFDSNRLKRSLMRNGVKRNRLKVLCNPGFPLYYMLRNLGWLKSENWWTNLSPRARRVIALKMISERVALFNEVENGEEPEGRLCCCARSLRSPWTRRANSGLKPGRHKSAGILQQMWPMLRGGKRNAGFPRPRGAAQGLA